MAIPFLSNIFNKGAKDLLDSSSKIIDNLTTNDQEKLKAKNELTQTVLSSLNNLQNAQRDVLLAETSGNWLQRSWRPVLMLGFGFIVIYAYFLEPAFFNKGEDAISKSLNDNFWALLKIGMGGYVIGRSAEKIATTVTKNSDISLLRKKDRKDVYG